MATAKEVNRPRTKVHGYELTTGLLFPHLFLTTRGLCVADRHTIEKGLPAAQPSFVLARGNWCSRSRILWKQILQGGDEGRTHPKICRRKIELCNRKNRAYIGSYRMAINVFKIKHVQPEANLPSPQKLIVKKMSLSHTKSFPILFITLHYTDTVILQCNAMLQRSFTYAPNTQVRPN